MDHQLTKITSIEPIEYNENDYVYDVIMRDDTKPWFFANDLLVHNSAYFTMAGLVDNAKDAIDLADEIAKLVNESFIAFMQGAFNCQPGFDDLIKANRELVCRSGLLQAKKKYMMAMVDKEGKKFSPGDEDELKTMGSDIKLSSTPEPIRLLLKEVVMNILNEVDKSVIDEVIIKFREELKNQTDSAIDPLDLSSIISIKELEEYFIKWEAIEQKGYGKVSMPANARASINYNTIIKELDEDDEPEIMSGDKIKMLWLKENKHGFLNMAFPSDTDVLPEWFKEHFEADMALMEQKLVDQKIQNIFDALDWSVPTFQSQLTARLIEIDDAGAKKKGKTKRKAPLTPEQENERLAAANNLLDFD